MKAKIEPWKAWLTEWQPPYAANQHNHPSDCRCCGVNRARGRVALVLAALDVPLLQLTPATLKKAFLNCGISPSYLDVLCATRKFLRWCQAGGHLPVSLVFEARRTPASAQRALEVAPACPWLLDALTAWKPAADTAWHNNFKRSASLALRKLDPATISAATLREAVASLGYSPGYSANVLFVLRQFLRHLQAIGRLSPDLCLTIEPPHAPPSLPAKLTREIDEIISSAKGLRTKRPWRRKVRKIIRSEVMRFISWNLAKGARIRSVQDLGWKHYDNYQDFLLQQVSLRSGQAIKKATVRNRMMYLLMFWRQGCHQDDSERIDPTALKKFQLIARTAPGTRPPIPEEIMAALLRFNEELFTEMSPFKQYHYLRRKTMVAVQESMWGRTEDIARLTVESIHFDRTSDKGLVPFDITSGKSRPQGHRETLMLFPPAVAMLKRWLAFRDRFFAERSIAIKPLMEWKFVSPSERLGTPVFTSIDGKPIGPQAYSKVVANALHAAVPGAHRRYSAYGIRHYGPHAAAEKGVHLKQIADRLRDNPLTAAQFYLAPEKGEDSDHAIWARLTGKGRQEPPPPVAPTAARGWTTSQELSDVVPISEVARLLDIDIHRLYRAIRKEKLTPHEMTLPSGGCVMGIRIAEARAWATSLTKGELSDLLFGERKPSNVYKLDLPLTTTRYGRQERVDAAEAAHLAIERRRLQRRGTLRIASRLRKPAQDLPAQPQIWRLSGELSPAAANPSLS